MKFSLNICTGSRKLRPLKYQLKIILFLFTLCLIAVTFYSAYDYTKLQSTVLEQNLKLYSSHLAKNTRYAYETYKNICYSIAYNHSLQSYIAEQDAQKRYDSYQQAENLLINTANLNPFILDIAVIGVDGNSIALKGSADTYLSFLSELETPNFTYSSLGIRKIGGSDCHVLAMPIYRLSSSSSNYLGVMFLTIDIETLFDSDSGEITNYDPQIIFAAQNGLVYGDAGIYDYLLEKENQIDEETITYYGITYIVNRIELSSIDYTLYVLIDKYPFHTQAMQIAFKQFFWMGAVLALLVLMLFLFYRPLIGSLHQLTEFMKKIAGGERKAMKYGITIEQGSFGCEEIAQISDAFNEMLSESERLNYTIFNTYTKMYELESNNRQTEIAFLRSQINPHFLYNTLTTICGMAAAGMDEEIISVTSALSSIFRYSIKGKEMVTLAEELEIVKSYLMIQMTRFEGRFSVRYDIADIAYDWLIPRMVIQPLVENAIVHGLEKKLEKGELLIGAAKNQEHGYLAIWIYDTGVGLPHEKLEKIRTSIAHSTKSKRRNIEANLAQMDLEHHDSIGILNVNTRMVLYYGEDYSLIMDSEEGVGTNIQLRIPPDKIEKGAQ